jgi:small-conductance mechanosensitive channel
MPAISNWGTAIVISLSAALALVFSFVPKLIGFLVILLVGWIIATLVAKAVTLVLRKVGFDRLSNRMGLTRIEQRIGIRMDTAGILGKVVYWFIFLIFLLAACDALGVPAITNILNQIVAFIPNVFVAILVLFLGSLAAMAVADLVRGAFSKTSIANPNLLANIARYAIIGFAAIIALEQLNITPALMNELFGAVIAGAALAFGLGGQESARRLLNRTEGTVTTAASQMSSQ